MPFDRLGAGVGFYELREIGTGPTECILDGSDIAKEPVSRDLDSAGESRRHILYELPTRWPITLTNEPRKNEFRFRVNRGERPDVALTFLRGVFLFRSAECPNLVALNALAGKMPERVVLVDRTELAKLDQKLEHRRLCGTG